MKEIIDSNKSDKEKLKKLQEFIKGKKIEELKIDGTSPLKYAIDNNHVDLAMGMVQMGFTTHVTTTKEGADDKTQIVQGDITQKQHETLETGNAPLFNIFKKLKNALMGEKKLSDKDQLRAAIAGKSIQPKDLENKPSLVQVAMKAGKKELALELIKKGHRLKRSEINEYMKEEKRNKPYQAIREEIKGSRFSLKQFDVGLQEKLATHYTIPNTNNQSKSKDGRS